MRIRQVGFSSRLKAHRQILTLETLKFIAEYFVDGNARTAALRSGVPEKYASRQGAWLKKHPLVVAALEMDLGPKEQRHIQHLVAEIEERMQICRSLLQGPGQDD